VTLVAGDNPVDFGTLREGDANDDNCVTLPDFSVLVTTFAKCTGDAGFDARADFNGDGCVTLVDFSLLVTNFGQCGGP
jgi:large repetitive protein